MSNLLRLVVGVIFFISVESNALQPGYKFIAEKVTASDGQPDNRFGYAVSISGNTALIGAPGDYTSSVPGAIYFFERIDNSWIEHQKFSADVGFGVSVSIFGDNAAVISNQNVNLYRRESDQWQFVEVIASTDFPCSISITNKFLAIYYLGAVELYEYINEDWVYQQTLTIEGSPPISCNNIELSGDTLVIGLEGTHIFNQVNGVWIKSQEIISFGSTVSISGNTLVARSDGLQTIGVYEASYNSALPYQPLWELQQEFTDPLTLAEQGFALGLNDTSLSGDLAVINRNPYQASFGPSALVYTRAGGVWSQRQNLSAGVYGDNSRFGEAISTTDNTILVGAYRNGSTHNNGSTESLSGGAVYFFSPHPDIDTPAMITADVTSIYPSALGKITAIDMDGLNDPNYLSVSKPPDFNGSISVYSDGTFISFPPGNIPDYFTVTVTDDLGGTTEQIISLNDSDNDGEFNSSDNCPDISNPNQNDLDEDGAGDACDNDVDGDGFTSDNDYNDLNAYLSADPDNDGVDSSGTSHYSDNVCLRSPLCNENDPCITVCYVPPQDNCPTLANSDQSNIDGDADGDACDLDIDGDLIRNSIETAAGMNPNDPSDGNQAELSALEALGINKQVPAMGGIGLLALGLSMLGLGAVRMRKK